MDPPFDEGAVQVTTDCPFAFDVPETEVGAPGTVEGVTADEALEDAEVPIALIATTVKVYVVPLVSPVKVQLKLVVFVHPDGGVTLGEDVTE